MQLMDLDVTSVTKQPEPYARAPAAIDVITQEDITRSGASSIPEILRLADNLEVAQKNSHDWGITARGFNTDLSNKLLVLIDGRTVYTPLFSGVAWDVQDTFLADIDRVEVISGPGGTLWGSNAVNGVINITTKSAKDTQGLYAEAGGGSELEDFASIRYGGLLTPAVSYRVYVQSFDRGDEEFENGKEASDSWKQQQAGFRMDAAASPDTQLTFQGDIYGGDENEPTGGDEKVGGGNLLGRWTHTFSVDSQSSLQAYFDQTYVSEPVAASAFAKAGILVDRLSTYDLDFQDSVKTSTQNRLLWGAGYRFTRDSVSNAPALAFYPTRLDQSLASAFLQDEFAFRPGLSVTVGSKIEHNAYTGTEWEPSARAQWAPATANLLWAAVSRAIRAPSRVDRDIAEPNPPPAVLLGSSTFESETLIAYELGYRAELGSQASLSLSTFYNSYDHLRSLSFTPATIIPLFFQNNLEGDTYGAELSANYQILPSWRLHAGYNLLRENIRVKPGASDLNHALNETSDPKHQVSLRSSLDLPYNTQLEAAWRWVDTLHDNNGGVVGIVPSYAEMDLRFAWQISRAVSVSVVGQNLLHSSHVEYGTPGPDREAIERSIYGKATWRY